MTNLFYIVETKLLVLVIAHYKQKIANNMQRRYG